MSLSPFVLILGTCCNTHLVLSLLSRGDCNGKTLVVRDVRHFLHHFSRRRSDHDRNRAGLHHGW